MIPTMKKVECDRCRRMVPIHEMTTASDGKGGTHGTFCARCWSEYLGEHRGEEIEAVEVKPMKLTDAAGRVHTFHFRYNPLPRNLEAFELKKGIPGGYHFQVMAEGDEPHSTLVGKILTRIRRALARQHVRPCDMSESGFSIVGDSCVAGSSGTRSESTRVAIRRS